MVRPASSDSHDQSATLRKLKLLIVVLVVSNIGLGGLSFYLMRAMDRTYTDLLGLARTYSRPMRLAVRPKPCGFAMTVFAQRLKPISTPRPGWRTRSKPRACAR